MGNKPVFERVHVVFQETGAATSIEPECVRGKVFGNERGVSFGLCGPRCSAKGNLDRLGLRQRHNAASTYHSRGPLSSLFSLPCFSSIILSPPNGNVKMSPHERKDIRVESEGTATSERNFQLLEGKQIGSAPC